MKILITGIAGFVGSRLAQAIADGFEGATITGIDNLSRRGSQTNLSLLRRLDCAFVHGDIRSVDDVQALPKADWIIDCAANPSVLAGVDGDSAQVVGNNLIGTLNLLEKCRRDSCGFLMMSTSRVYSIPALLSIPLKETSERFVPDSGMSFPIGFSNDGIGEAFSTASPISLYGATKLASEIMALEYAADYKFPIWINRCGVIAGAGQFGKIDQGIFSYWIYRWLLGESLSYIGFGGEGKQVRDLLAPEDLTQLVLKQLAQPDKHGPKVVNVGGGQARSLSLQELSQFCATTLQVARDVKSEPTTRPFDIPFYVTDNNLARKTWDWNPQTTAYDVLEAILNWAHCNRALIEEGF